MQGDTRGTQPQSAQETLPRAVRVAVVRHERAEGGDHLDLFVGPRGAAIDAPVARSWRLPLEAWTSEGLAAGRFAAIPTPAHRAEYLDLRHARELSEGRGLVVPLAAGDGDAAVDGTLNALGCTLRFSLDDGGNPVVEIANHLPRSACP